MQRKCNKNLLSQQFWNPFLKSLKNSALKSIGFNISKKYPDLHRSFLFLLAVKQNGKYQKSDN